MPTVDVTAVERLLGSRVTGAVPLVGRDIGGRWTEDHAHLWRVTVGGSTVVVKTLRGDDLSSATYLRNEAAALEFLGRVGGGHGPLLLAADGDVVVMEDLGAGTSLDQVLLGDDPEAALSGLRSFATSLGRMHADTAGREDEYYAIRGDGDGDPMFDRLSLGRYRLAESWRKTRMQLRGLPTPGLSAIADWDLVMARLASPGERLAFSNGDACPQNCRLVADGRVRFLDFDGAAFRHAALDLAALLLPFPACACWSTLPPTVGTAVVDAYRTEFAVDDLDAAVGCAAWVVLRAVRLRRLGAAINPHPMGFSRRGQLLDQLAVAAGPVGAPLPGLAAWFGELEAALRERWGITEPQGEYPAFGVTTRPAAAGSPPG